MTLDFDDLLKKIGLEERLYRHRCVEAWSMAVPWTGFPMAALVDFARPLGSAKYVRMETFMDPKTAPEQKKFFYPWPYVEGLTMAEARNELAFLVTGMYGKPVPKQDGAPLRLAVPWKYGFKSVKSIVRFEFTDKRPDLVLGERCRRASTGSGPMSTRRCRTRAGARPRARPRHRRAPPDPDVERLRRVRRRYVQGARKGAPVRLTPQRGGRLTVTTRQPWPMPGPSIWSMRVTEQFSIVKARHASGFEAERQAERGADRAAMRHRDDVAAAIGVEHAMDRARDPLHHIDKALAAGRALMRRGMPEAVERAAARMAQLLVGQALPVAETLLGEIGDRRRVGAGDLGRARAGRRGRSPAPSRGCGADRW